MRACLLGVFIGLFACTDDVEVARKKAGDLAAQNPRPVLPSSARMLEREGGGVVAYLGLDIDPPDPKPGQTLNLTHYFRVIAQPMGDAAVFVHGDAGGRRLVSGDVIRRCMAGSRRVPGGLATSGQTGTQSRFLNRLRELWSCSLVCTEARCAGLLKRHPDTRMAKTGLGAAKLTLGAPTEPVDDLPVVEIPKIDQPIVPDGVLDEGAWARAAVLTFADSLGRRTKIRHATRLRLLYDDKFLYVGFEADDIDITERYSRRDDPIYEHETVELFIMPNVAAPQTGPYVELQASPGGVIFDASFDGPRQGMNKRFGAGQTVGTKIHGTLNDPSPDERWVSEWKVPFTGIRGVRQPPKAGDEWRMNAFRIEKFRDGQTQRGEYSAWSPPGVGDFHHVPAIRPNALSGSAGAMTRSIRALRGPLWSALLSSVACASPSSAPSAAASMAPTAEVTLAKPPLPAPPPVPLATVDPPEPNLRPWWADLASGLYRRGSPDHRHGRRQIRQPPPSGRRFPAGQSASSPRGPAGGGDRRLQRGDARTVYRRPIHLPGPRFLGTLSIGRPRECRFAG